MTQQCLEMQLSSTFEELERAVVKLQAFVGDMRGISEELADRIVLLASEAITNAMDHGNKWQPDKVATLCLTIHKDKVQLDVTDEGCGFKLPANITEALTPEKRMNDHGRGLLLMHEFADEVHLLSGTNRLRLVLYRKVRHKG